MAEDQVRSISRWLEIKAGLIVDRSEAVIIWRGGSEAKMLFLPCCIIEDRVYGEEECRETRKKFHLANPRYPYSTFGERNARFLLDKISHRCRYQMSNLPSRGMIRCILLTPYSAVLRREHLHLLLSILVSFPRLRDDRQLTKLSSHQIDSWPGGKDRVVWAEMDRVV